MLKITRNKKTKNPPAVVSIWTTTTGFWKSSQEIFRRKICIPKTRLVYPVKINAWKDQDVYTSRIKERVDMASGRNVQVDRANYKEKVDGEILPYENSLNYVRMEVMMWADSAINGPLKHLRNRGFFVTTKSGILRGESLFQAELSDLMQSIIHESITGEIEPNCWR
jgi:hypothetical protein